MPVMKERVNPQEYFEEEGGFQAYSFASDLVETFKEVGAPFATVSETDHIYAHDGLIYHDRGEQRIEKEVRQTFGDAVSEMHVNEVKHNVRVLTRAPRESVFDLKPHKVVVENGLIDMRTGEFEESPPSSPPGTMVKVPQTYDPEATCPAINEFLHDILPEDRVPEIYELIGYTLYRGYPYQKAFMFLGSGANGKSTLIELIERFLGDGNVSHVSLQSLDDNRFAPADLVGKLANLSADLSDDAMYRTGVFKQLTGGDTLRAERKYESGFQFENQATMVFAANELPETKDETEAYYRRWKMIDFPHQFTGDDARDQEDLLAELEEEFSGLLTAAIGGFQRLSERGGFKVEGDLAEIQEEYERRSNSVKAFTEDRVSAATGEMVNKKEAWQTYRSYCEEKGMSAKSYPSFKNDLEEEIDVEEGKDPNDRRRTVWKGLSIDGHDSETKVDGQSQLESVAADGNGDLPQEALRRKVLQEVQGRTADGGLADRESVEEFLEGETDRERIGEMVEKLLTEGVLYQPETGKIRTT